MDLARMPGLHPYSFKRHPGIFCDHRESGLRFNVFDSIGTNQDMSLNIILYQ